MARTITPPNVVAKKAAAARQRKVLAALSPTVASPEVMLPVVALDQVMLPAVALDEVEAAMHPADLADRKKD